MTAWMGLVAVVLILVVLDVAAWAFGVDSRDPCDRDAFGHDASRRVPSDGGHRG